MKLHKKEKVILTIIFGFFVLLTIVALLIRFNFKSSVVNIPYGTSNAKTLQNKIEQFIENERSDDKKITWKTSSSYGVYTILIRIQEKNDEGNYIPHYKSYYYDIKNDKELDRKEVAKLFNYTEDIIYDKIEEYFMNLYSQEVNLKIFDREECSFISCYMDLYRKCSDLSDYALYVDNETLYAYIGFDINSEINDEEFFKNLDYDYYKIEIK